MSLTSQLYDGPVDMWCRLRLPHTAGVVQEIQAAVRTVPPVRPAGRAVGDHWATIGGMVGARLALWVEHAPPYPALFGMVRAGLVSRTWAQRQAGLFPTHVGKRPDVETRGLELRPAPDGWVDAGYVPDDGPPGPAENVLGDLLAGFRAFAGQQAAPGTIGPDGTESVLARVLWVLNGLEDAYRGGSLPETLVGLFARPSVTVSDLVNACPGYLVEEYLAILARGRAHGLAQMRDLAQPGPGGALGHSDPVFVPHWADGDILLTGAQGSTLVDVKTVIRTDDDARVARWLQQILAYAAIDTTDEWKRHGSADRWRIRRVGLYLARHGVLVSWPVEELWGRMLGTDHPIEIANARRELRTELEIAATGEGARLLWPTGLDSSAQAPNTTP